MDSNLVLCLQYIKSKLIFHSANPPPLPLCHTGVRLEVEIVTELSAEGSFWCQLVLASEVGASYDRLQETLQVGAGRGDNEAFTPVFYHEGELCTARFSEDEDWYRARIERVCPGAVRTQHTVTTSE